MCMDSGILYREIWIIRSQLRNCLIFSWLTPDFPDSLTTKNKVKILITFPGRVRLERRHYGTIY
jgi:hypothetical protein